MERHLHPLRPAGVSLARHGDFGLNVQGDVISVSLETFAACNRLNIKTAEALLSTAGSLPSSVAGELGWTVPDVLHAVAEARRRLAGVVSAEYVSDAPRQTLAYGAFPPIASERVASPTSLDRPIDKR